MEQLKEIIAKITDEEYEKIKSESTTYREFEEKIKEYSKAAAWEQDRVKGIIGERMKTKFWDEVLDQKIKGADVKQDTDIIESTKNFIIRVLEGNSAEPQETAILPQIMDKFEKLKIKEMQIVGDSQFGEFIEGT